MQAVEPADVLRHSSTPRYREGHKQCVETRIVESFPDAFAGGEENALFVVRNARQSLAEGLGTHPTSQNDQVTDTIGEPLGEYIDVPVALRQN